MHAYHPREHDEDAPIYFDGCEECEHKSHEPWAHLDMYRMAELWNVMVAVEKRGTMPAYRSAAEARAAKWCYHVAIFLERYSNIDPWRPLSDLMFQGLRLA